MVPRLPAGAIIVLVGSGLFVVSMVFGTSRGALVRVMTHYRLTRRVGRQHVLRAVYEALEGVGSGARDRAETVSFERLLGARSWSAGRLKRLLAAARREGLVARGEEGGDRYGLTEEGWGRAERVVRNHRLWEMYLITHADVAPSHVDRDADQIEHVLDPGLVARLESLLQGKGRGGEAVPPSPHAV